MVFGRVKMFVCLFVVFMFILSGCSVNSGQNHKHDSELQNVLSQNSTDNIIEESDFYSISYKNGNYYYRIVDNSGNTVIENDIKREPKIENLYGKFLKLTVQWGTGITTRTGYFYDYKENILSKEFACVYDQTEDMVVYGKPGGIVVSSIFDDSFYIEFSSFKYIPSDTPEFVLDAVFLNGENAIEVTYLTGASYEKVSEIFNW